MSRYDARAGHLYTRLHSEVVLEEDESSCQHHLAIQAKEVDEETLLSRSLLRIQFHLLVKLAIILVKRSSPWMFLSLSIGCNTAEGHRAHTAGVHEG